MQKTNKIINTWWSKGPHPGNMGDIVTPVILRDVFGYECQYAHKPFTKPTLFGAGSIINQADGHTVVWGSGAMRATDPLKRDARYLSVRGPRTYEMLRSKRIPCPEIFGDPALLLPEVYSPERDVRFEIGMIPHYVDYPKVNGWYVNHKKTGVPPPHYKYPPPHGVKIRVIDILNGNPLLVVAQMLSCEKIISSSLHGVIVAQAYGIPAVWVKHSDKLNGDGTKFHDYFESVGLKAECVDMTQRIDPEDLRKLNFQAGINIDLNKLKRALQGYLDELSNSN